MVPHVQIGLGAAVALLVAGPVLAAGIEGIVVDTDRSVNCASLKTIVADVCRGCKTDQQKAIAIYDFVVRTVWMPYVYGQPKEMIRGRLESVRDPLKVLNVYGAAGCDIQADLFCTLLDAAGLGSRRLDPGFAHASSEVKWDGKWHWMDVWLPCYFKDEKGRIYSYGELMGDRGLIAKAIAAGRVSEDFMFNPGPDVKTITNAKNYGPGGSGVRKCHYLEDLALRPGESCTWLWDHVGKWYWPEEKFACPAFKFARDKACKRAFPYWQPYGKAIKNGPHPWNDTYYRYYGNAIFTHDVPLTQRGLTEWGAKLMGASFAKGGMTGGKGDACGVELTFQLPHVIADTEVAGTVELPTPRKGASLRLDCSLDGGRTFHLAGRVTQSGPFKLGLGKPNSRDFPQGVTTGRYGFVLRVVVDGGAETEPTILKRLKVVNTTMLNFYSRPQLELGKNKVSVTARNGQALAKTPLEITWRWVENWHRPDAKERTFAHSVDRAGATRTIAVGGEKRPKMKSVTIACFPRSLPAATRRQSGSTSRRGTTVP